MDSKSLQFSDLTSKEEQKLKDLEKQFTRETGKSLYLLAFDKK